MSKTSPYILKNTPQHNAYVEQLAANKKVYGNATYNGVANAQLLIKANQNTRAAYKQSDMSGEDFEANID